MMATWMLCALAFSALAAAAAHLVETALPERSARRHVWTVALALSVAVPLLALATGGMWRPGLLPAPAVEVPGLLLPTQLSGDVVISTHASDAATAGGIPGSASQPGSASAAESAPASGAASGSPLPGAPRLAVHAMALRVWLLFSILAAVGYAALWLRFLGARTEWRRRRLCGRDVYVAARIGPAVFGLGRASIVLPEWVLHAAPAVQRVIMLHESEHARAGDHVLLGLAPLALIALPWNLPLWWHLHRLRLAVELDCDARVLRRGVAPRAYGSLLIDIAGHSATLPTALAALAAPRTFLERRILAMTPHVSRRSRFHAAALAAAAVLLLLGAFESFALMPAADVTPPDVPTTEAADPATETGDATAAPATPRTDIPAPATQSSAPSPSPLDSVDLSRQVWRSASPDAGAAAAAVEQEADAPGVTVYAPDATGRESSGATMAADTPLVVVNDVLVPQDALAGVLVNATIASVTVLSGDAAVARYGDRAAAGVLVITTTSTARAPGAGEAPDTVRPLIFIDGVAMHDPKPLIVIDGMVLGTDVDLSGIEVARIQSMEIVKGPAAVRMYGDRAAGGVIRITTKR